MRDTKSNTEKLTEHLEYGLLGLGLLALPVHGRVLPEGCRLPYPEAHPDVEEDHDGHRDDEEEQGGELEEERRGRLGRLGKKDV